MAIEFPIEAVVCTHVGACVFLFRGLRNGVISGVSMQTVVALAAVALLGLAQKMYWKVISWWLNVPIDIGGHFAFEMAGGVLEAFILIASAYVIRKNVKGRSEAVKGNVEDDFGKSEASRLWFALGGRRAPPAHLHWALIYVASLLISLCLAWASAGFSFGELYEWASSRPTAMMAIFMNNMRGLSWIPQLHVSKKVGIVSPGLALWIAMLGLTDIVELVRDGTVFTRYVHGVCYIAGDVISLMLIVDFMWIFFKSQLLGKKHVEIPLAYQV